MEIGQKMQSALNGQINAELHSAYVYLAMSAYFQSIDLPGFAGWMNHQAREEVAHAMRIFDFMVERGGRVKLATVEQPPADWKSPLDAFQAAYKHEQHITKLIHDLVDTAVAEKDHATRQMLDWFVAEQVEEEATAAQIVAHLERAGEAGTALLMLDRQLGQRGEG